MWVMRTRQQARARRAPLTNDKGRVFEEQIEKTIKEAKQFADEEQVTLTAVPSSRSSQCCTPQSGESVGFIKETLDTMEHNLVDITRVEKQAITECEALLAAKAKEIATNTQPIRAKAESWAGER